MARFRLSRPAQADFAHILATSAERWGSESRHRYATLLGAAMRQVADDPQGRTTRTRADLLPELRSFHLRHARVADPATNVREPVHVLYYRVVTSDVIEIVRVLHERMDPVRHIDMTSKGRR